MTKYPSTRPRTQDVVDVLRDLGEYIDRLEQETPEEARSQRQYNRTFGASLLLLLCAFVLLVVGSVQPIPHLQIITSTLIVLAAVVSVVAAVRVVRQQPRVFRSLRQPRKALIARLEGVLEWEEAYVGTLLCYDLVTLQFARARLTQAVEVSRERAEAVLGPVGKLGLFPSVLAAAATVISTLKGAPLWAQLIAVAATLLLVLNQNAAATMQMGLLDARLMFGLLDRAIGIREGEAASEARARVLVGERV